MSFADDLLSECEELRQFVSSLSETRWQESTAFFGWTTFDQILHLLWVDRLALASATDPEEFARLRDAQARAVGEGIEMSAQTRREFGHLDKAGVLEAWHSQYLRLTNSLAALAPDQRISWFGPDMSVASMLTARQMEVWAHGQDIYDLFEVSRSPHPRLRNICELGVRTFGWSFANRQLTRPGPTPEVRLQAPGEAIWVWNEGAEGSVTGSAEDFALVVTQRRNVLDTNLVCDGEAAQAWLAIAQCFAGPPAEPPPPGTRRS